MKKGRNRWFALLLILTLIFTLGMPMGMTAFGDGEDPEITQEQPEVQDPEVKDPEVQDPEVQDPEVQDPEVQDPEVQDPEVQDPEVKDPEVQDPEVQDPEVQDPEVQDPEVKDPEVQDPELKEPTLLKAQGDFSEEALFKRITLVVGSGGVAYVDNVEYLPGTYHFDVWSMTNITAKAYSNAGYKRTVPQSQTTSGKGNTTVTVSFAPEEAVYGMPYYAADGAFSGYDGTGTDISGHDPKGDALSANMSGVGGTVQTKLGEAATVSLNVSGVNGDYVSHSDRTTLREVDIYDSLGNKISRDAVTNGDRIDFSYSIPGTIDGLLSAGYTKQHSGKYAKTVTYQLVDRYNGNAAAAVLATASVRIEVDPINATIYITADDYYELYVDGELIGSNADWTNVEAYRVTLKDSSVIAVYAKDTHLVVDGLSVKIDYVNPSKQDVVTSEGSGWFYRVIPTQSVPSELSEWKTAPVIYKHDGWAGVKNATYGWAAKLGGKAWNEPWVWSPNYTAPDFDKYVLFRFNGAELGQEFVTVSVSYEGQGKVFIGEETDPLLTETTVEKGSSLVLHAVPAEGWIFDRWTVDGNPMVSSPGATWTIENADASHSYEAHFVEGFQYTVVLDPEDESVNVPKNKVLSMTFNGMVQPGFKYRNSVGDSVVRQDDFRIFNADGTLFESFNVLYEGPEIGAADAGRILLMPTVNEESVGYIEGNQVVLDPKQDFVPGASYYVLANGFTILNTDMMPATVPLSQYQAWFLGFGEKETLADHDWNFTIAPAAVIGGGGTTPGGSPGGQVSTVTTIAPEETPLAAPVVEEAPMPAPIEALQEIVEDVAPLGVPVLPKTGEIPASLFYGLGGILAAAGAFMKRK